MILKLAALSAPQLLSKVSMPGFHDLPANFLLDIFLFACPLRDPHPRHPTEGPDWPARFFFGSPQGSSVYRPFEGGQFLVSYFCLRAFPFVANAFCCFSIHCNVIVPYARRTGLSPEPPPDDLEPGIEAGNAGIGKGKFHKGTSSSSKGPAPDSKSNDSNGEARERKGN